MKSNFFCSKANLCSTEGPGELSVPQITLALEAVFSFLGFAVAGPQGGKIFVFITLDFVLKRLLEVGVLA